MDVGKYGLIYGGVQKNMGPAGVTIVVVKEDILGKVERKLPAMVNYKTHFENNSMYNTPPVVCIFTILETLKWVKAQGA